MRYTVIVARENGQYLVQIPSLPGLSAKGATQEEALKEAQHLEYAQHSVLEGKLNRCALFGFTASAFAL